MPNKLTLTLAALVSLAGFTAHAGTVGTVHRYVTTGDTVDGQMLTSIGNGPDINNSGQIVYTANGGNDIFINQGHVVGSGTTIGGVDFDYLYGSQPVINNNGTIAFSFRDSSSTTYIATQNALLQNLSQPTGDGHYLYSIGSTTINDSGLVAFGTSIYDGGSKSAIASKDALIAEGGTTIDGVTIKATFAGDLPRHGLNSNGDVLFMGSDASSNRYVMTQNTVLAKPGDTIDGHTLGILNGTFAINDSDNALFENFNTSTSHVELFTLDKQLAAVGQVIDGHTIQSFGTSSSMDLNNNGQAAWYAEFNDGGAGIFVNSNLLVATGDLIDGKTVASLANPSINDNGLLAAYATYTDGTSGIITAAVPEPTSLALLGLGGLMLLGGNFRARRD